MILERSLNQSIIEAVGKNDKLIIFRPVEPTPYERSADHDVPDVSSVKDRKLVMLDRFYPISTMRERQIRDIHFEKR